LDELAVAGGQPGLDAGELLGVLGGVASVERLGPQPVVLLKVGVALAQDLVLQAQAPPLDGRQVDRVGAGPLGRPAGQLVDQGAQEVSDRGVPAARERVEVVLCLVVHAERDCRHSSILVVRIVSLSSVPQVVVRSTDSGWVVGPVATPAESGRPTPASVSGSACVSGSPTMPMSFAG